MSIPLYPYICPVCDQLLSLKHKSYVCPSKHLFDVSKSGYVNLLPVHKKNSLDPGDNKDMIRARGEIMDKGYYQSLACCIGDLLSSHQPNHILDAGCGVGYLAHKLHIRYPNATVLGTDISKFAINLASKKYKNIPFSVASSNALPIATDTIDALVCAFAPVFGAEFLRVLKTGGVFIRVIPGAKHLLNLKALLYQTPVHNQTDPHEIDGFTWIKTAMVHDTFDAKNTDELISLVQMTPYFYNANKTAIAQLSSVPSLIVEQEFEVRLYTKD